MDADVDALADRIAALPRPLLLAFDVDGTLAPIVQRPDEARVPPPTRRWLKRLVGYRGVEVAFVTGRDPAALRKVVHVPGAWRAVEHGRRVIPAGQRASRLKLDPEARARLATFRRWAAQHAQPRGARLEDKEGSVGVHVRGLEQRSPEAAAELLEQAAREAQRLGLHARRGRAVCEAEVQQGDKGIALQRLLDATGAAAALYAGDDLTDFPAIRHAADGGVGLFVRSPERRRKPRGASSVLEGPEQVAELVAALAKRLGADVRKPSPGSHARRRNTRANPGRRPTRR